MMKDYMKEYNFLEKSNSVEDYIPPEYYNELLKPYVFLGKTDLQIFEDFLIKQNDIKNILEICSGSGRVSDVTLKNFPNAKLTLSDLSQYMLDYTKNKFNNNKNISYIKGDAVMSTMRSNQKYDLIYTLWGFSHSVHQHIHKNGIHKTKLLLENFFRNVLKNNLTENGKFYLMHFDSMSDEQRILMRQWRRVYPTFSDIGRQSPSKIILDEILHDLDNTNKIILTERHLLGDPIIYENEKILLEIFLNFHLETYFNRSILLPEVIEDIKEQITKYRMPDGSFSIRTGCYVYEIEKR